MTLVEVARLENKRTKWKCTECDSRFACHKEPKVCPWGCDTNTPRDLRGEARRQLADVAISGSSVTTRPGVPEEE